jgi:iron complex outermembrane receptor protein
MKLPRTNLRNRLLLFTAFTMVGALAGNLAARAQTATPVVVPDSSGAPMPVIVPGQGTPEDLNAYEIQKVKIEYKKLLLREKDIPNAVSELNQKAVQAANPTTGSIQTLLNQTPNVVAYSQQLGQDNTTLAIRGVRNDELAETLDGIPINNLLVGSGDYVSDGAVGSPVTLNEIDGVTVYPGLASPEHQGFGTVGGTIAYTTKQPTDDRSEELEGGFGSFDTQHFGFTINTGKMGDGPDAPKALILYDQSQTAGYVDNTPAQFHDFMLNVVKPYDDGLSKLGLVIIFNQGKALVQTLPAPTALIQAEGYKFNYPISDGFYNQADQDLTVIASDETYINKYAIFDGSLFFRHEAYTIDDYDSPDIVDNGYVFNGVEYTPNIQGIGSFFGCVGPTDFRNNGLFTYDPTDGGTQDCAAGESDEYITGHNNIVGFTPKLTLFPDDYNTIVIGGLLAKANSGSAEYVYGGDAAAQNQDPGYDSFTYGGGTARTIFSAYAQDTIRLFGDRLQITPGVKVDAAYTDNIQQTVYGLDTLTETTQQAAPATATTPAVPYVAGLNKFQNFTKIGGYYLGASYNLPENFILFGSLGKGSLFAPTNDYSGGVSAGIPGGTDVPEPEIVHLYEGGIRYDTPRLLLSLDYYYQAIANGFSFFVNYASDAQFYGNSAGYLFRGVEGNGKFLVTPDLAVFGNFSYDKAEYTKSSFLFDTLAQDQFGYAFSGTPLSNVPDWTGLIGVSYDYGPFSFYATGQYTGREYTTTDLNAPPYGNTCTSSGAAGPVECPKGTQGGTFPVTINGVTYNSIPSNPLDAATVTNTSILNPANFLLNVLVTYHIPVHSTLLKSLTASLNMENLTDEHYYTYTYNSENPTTDPVNGYGGIYDPGLPGGAPFGSGFLGEPRSFTVDLVAKF